MHSPFGAVWSRCRRNREAHQGTGNIYCEEASVGSGKQSLRTDLLLINMPKKQMPGKEFCKINVNTSNGHKPAVNKFGLEVKFLTVRRINSWTMHL